MYALALLAGSKFVFIAVCDQHVDHRDVAVVGDAQLGRYRILAHLATGGMAEVFLAKASGIEGFERHVVIKCIHKEHARNESFVRMFLEEARLAAALHHHNIVQVHDIGEEDGEYFYAMEYVHGEDLRSLLMAVTKRDQQVPLEHVVSIISGAAAGLHYAHEQVGSDRKPLGLVHRDVSPSNIIVDFDGNVKVVDFGIAKAALRTDQTRSGVLKGKVAYMSPEQCRGKPIDRRSDVYALGIVLYELTTARRLFKGDNDFMTMSTIVAGDIPLPSKRRKNLPPALEEIIMTALAKEPAERFQSAHELRRALDAFAASEALRVSATGLADYMLELFGHRPEPWLVDVYAPPADLTSDFDGAASGVAGVSFSAVQEFVAESSEPQSSPLMKARARAVTGGPTRSTEQMSSQETNASGTPMAWTPQAPPAPVQSRRWLSAVVAVVVIAAVSVVVVPRMSADEDVPRATSATEPAMAPAAATPIAAPPQVPTPPAEPASAAPIDAGITPPVSSVETPLAPTTKPVLRKPPPKRQPANRKPSSKPTPTSDPAWDPDSLLPD